MTTNAQKAQRIVGGVIDRLTTDKSGLPVATRITQALADAGLLMPDLLEPRDTGSGIARFSRGVQVWDRQTVRVYLADDYGQGKARLTPQEARAYGEELIAAANYAEQEQSNE